MSVTVHQLKDALYNLLNQREQSEFIEVLNNYHARRNIQDFAQSLKVLLDTPAKRHILSLLRRVLPRSEVVTFDQLMNSGYDTNSLPRTLGRGHTPRHRPTGSTVSVPTRYYQTVPTRGAKVVRRTSIPEAGLGPTAAPPTTSNWEPGIINDVKTILVEKPRDPQESLGFSIRGGAEHGIGIYISYVDVDSVAERHGLIPGDQILAVNGLDFTRITHDEAAKTIKAAKSLEIQVRNVGRVPGSFETHQRYTWVNPAGRNVSPPPEIDRIGRYEAKGQRKSGLMLLKDSDERKVNLVVTENRALGLMIRGGTEFGLGIYVTGVDRGSVAENGGVKVGDQILDVNGQSFLDINHAEAVKVLKSSRHMMMTIKDIGKIPHARTTYDHTQWLPGNKLPKKAVTRTEQVQGNPITQVDSQSVFTRGAGSQLMYSSLSSHQTTWSLIEEQAKQLLSDNERHSLNYYLTEYQRGGLSVDTLVLALFDLLNTHSKFSLITEIRGLVTPKDIEKFDLLVLQKEVQTFRSQNQDAYNRRISDTSSDRISKPSSSSTRVSLDPPFLVASSHLSLHKVVSDEDDALTAAIDQIPDETTEMPDYFSEPSPLSLNPQRSRSKSPSSGLKNGKGSNNITVAQVHVSPAARRILTSEDTRSPSEDSGVEMNGSGGMDSIHGIHYPVTPISRVTVSSQQPIIINDVLEETHYHTEDSLTSSNYSATENSLEPPRGYSNSQERSNKTNWSPVQIKPSFRSRASYRGESASSTPKTSPHTSPYLVRRTPEVMRSVPAQRTAAAPPTDTTPSQNQLLPRQHSRQRTPSPQPTRPPPPVSSSSATLQRPMQSNYASNGFFKDSHVSEYEYEYEYEHEHEPPQNQNGERQNQIMMNGSAEGCDSPVEEIETAVTKRVVIYKSKPTLGLAIEGGANTRQPIPKIINVQPGGSAHASGNLKVGQLILEVNGKSLQGLEHKDAARSIAEGFKSKSTNRLELIVLETKKLTI